jgi:hypothetical protein
VPPDQRRAFLLGECLAQLRIFQFRMRNVAP